MAREGVQISGDREARRAFDRMGKNAPKLERPNRDAAEDVAGAARGLVPVESGALLRDIRTAADDESGAALTGGRLPYAGVIHFGWPERNIEPQPFMYRAADRRADQIIERYEQHVARLVQRFDRDTPG